MPAGAVITQLNSSTEHYKYIIKGNISNDIFKNVFIRHSQIGNNIIDMEFFNQVDFGKINTVTLPTIGDYVHKIYVKFLLPELTLPSGSTYINWTNSIGHAMIDYIQLKINDYIITEHTGLYYEIIDEYNHIDSDGYNQLLSKYDNIASLTSSTSVEQKWVIIPLKFWFNTSLNNALPIHLMPLQTVKLEIKLKRFEELVIFDGATPPSNKSIVSSGLYVNYIFIPDSEKEFMKYNTNYEYIITQLQKLEVSKCTANQEVIVSLKDINHPAPLINLVSIEQESLNNNDYFNFNKRTLNPNDPLVPLIGTIKLYVDGNEYFDEQDEIYYRLLTPELLKYTNLSKKYIYTLPFCNNSNYISEYTGALNFSSTNDSNMYIKMNSNISESNLYIFITNYNIINIKNGYLSLLYIS